MSAPSDFRAYLRALWRWKVLFIALLLGLPAIAYAAVSREAKTYQSSVLLEENPASIDPLLLSGGSGVNVRPTGTTLGAEARIIETPRVAKLAATFLQPAPANPNSLLGAIKATPDSTTGFITVAATATNPTRAADIANAFGHAVVALRSHQAISLLTATINRLRFQLSRLHGTDANVQRVQLSQQLQEVVALRASQGDNAQILQAAVPDATPVSPRTLKVVGLAGVVGFLLAIGAVALAEATDRRIRNPDDLEELTKLPLLSVIPRSAFTAPPESSEAFQMLRSALTFFNVDQTLATILVTSPMKGDGKTTVATALALTVAHGGRRVVLIDADLRWPQAEKRLGIAGEARSPDRGLTGVLTGQASLQEALVDVPIRRGGDQDDQVADELTGSLRVLPGGGPAPNPSELLASQQMRVLLSDCARLADLVVIDTPPLLTVSDTIPLLDAVSGVVLVARLNGTPKDAIRRFLKTTSNTTATILGVVATGSVTGGFYGRYGYGYGYGYGPGYPNGNGSNGNGHSNGHRNGLLGLRLGQRGKQSGTTKQTK